MVWYSHLLKNFPQFVVIHRVKGFGIVNKAEIDVLLELSCFFNDPEIVGNFRWSEVRVVSVVATRLEKVGFIPIPKKGNAKECSNYCTIALIYTLAK